MGCDDWMGQLLHDMRPFIEEAGLKHVQAAALALNMDVRPGHPGVVVVLAEEAARRRPGRGSRRLYP